MNVILETSKEDLIEQLAEWGEPAFRAEQILQWVYQHRASDFSQMTNLPKALRERLASNWRICDMEVAVHQATPTRDAEKFVFQLSDKEEIESVVMRYHHGVSLCLSTQVGCSFGCAFCASGAFGFSRNLTVGEIMGQWYRIQQVLDEEDERVTHLVFMGMGEPLANFTNTLTALRRFQDSEKVGISYRRMTLSTVGLIPEIERLAAESLPITLAISLHAPNDYLRSQLMPQVNARYPLKDLIPVCRQYAEKTGRRVTFEYAMMKDVNDHPELARELGVLLGTWPCHVNLIPFNPIDGASFAPSDAGRIAEFEEVLKMMGVSVTVRRSLGRDIEGACGQLRGRRRKT